MDLMLHGSHAVSTIGRPGAGTRHFASFLLTALAAACALVLRQLGIHDPHSRQR